MNRTFLAVAVIVIAASLGLASCHSRENTASKPRMDEGVVPAVSAAATTRENRRASVGVATGLHIEFSTATAEVTADGELNIGVTLSVFAARHVVIQPFWSYAYCVGSTDIEDMLLPDVSDGPSPSAPELQKVVIGSRTQTIRLALSHTAYGRCFRLRRNAKVKRKIFFSLCYDYNGVRSNRINCSASVRRRAKHERK